MKSLKLNTGPGDTFSDVSKEAKERAIRHEYVEFEFNGVNCFVNKDTNLDWLWRDYLNSWLMEWKEIGPDCLAAYPDDVQKELEQKREAKEKEQERLQAEYKKKCDEERAAFDQKVTGVSIELTDEKGWNVYKESNQDPYGKCCVDYAESWARLMQVEFSKGETIASCAERTSNELDFYGITGFMYGAAVSMLAQCWKHGEALRLWHNLKSQIGTEGERANENGGVLNPALLTIG